VIGITQEAWFGIIALFGLALWLAAIRLADRRSSRTAADYLVADRAVPWQWGAPSIAASWIWAPALFVSIQKTYEFGLAGAFWFTVPNVLALATFAVLAPIIRRKTPEGITLPGWILLRFGSRRLHAIYLVPYVWYQLMAVCVQVLVGGLMLQYMTGLPLTLLMVLLLAVTLSYALKSGMRASIVTDFIQMAVILVGLALTLPLLVSTVGWDVVKTGTAGVLNTSGIWDAGVAYSFGIVTSIGLLAGAISDQQYWQRAFSIREAELKKAFVGGAVLFGIVPASLAVIGLVAAAPGAAVQAPVGTQLPMIGIAVVAQLLPLWAVVVFVLMLLAGLTSTLDSGLCAGSALYAVDIAGSGNRLTDSAETLRRSRLGMVFLAAAGLALAYVVQFLFSLDRLWWIFNGVASCFVVPTVLSILWPRLSEKGAFWGIVASLVGMVAFVYGNWIQDTDVIVASAVGIVVGNGLICWLFRTRRAPGGAAQAAET